MGVGKSVCDALFEPLCIRATKRGEVDGRWSYASSGGSNECYFCSETIFASVRWGNWRFDGVSDF